MQITGYHLHEALFRNATHGIYRGRRVRDEQPVLIKVIQETADDPAARARLEWEYEITRALSVEGVVPVYNLVPFGSATALILEDVGCQFLRNCLDEGRLDLDTSLSIALQLAAILASLHQLHVVHKAIHPTNILVHLERSLRTDKPIVMSKGGSYG